MAAVDDRAVAAGSTAIGEGGADAEPAQQGAGETSSAWQSHGERSLYDNEWVRLSLVDVELRMVAYEHHVVSMKPAAMTALSTTPRSGCS